MFKTMSIKAGLLTWLVLMTIILFVVSGISIHTIRQGAEFLQSTNRVQGEELGTLSSAYTASLRARAEATLAARQFETGLTSKAQASTNLAKALDKQADEKMAAFLVAASVTTEGARRAQQLNNVYQRYSKQGVNAMLTALSEADVYEYYQVLENVLAPLSIEMEKQLDSFQLYAQQTGKDIQVDAAQGARTQLALVILACLLSLALATAAWLLVKFIVLRPLDSAIAHLEQIASGDLYHPVAISQNKELGRLSRALALMQDALAEAVGKVRQAGAQIDAGTRELASGNINLSQRTEASAAALEQTAASMEQLTQTVKLNAEHSRQAHELAKTVSDTADKGAEVVCYVIEKMQAITTSSRRIADILGVIDGIAFQTNILALNAAVEAARAGEQGRGFAVVAGEVRNLAHRSAEAAKEIKGLINESQGRVDEGSQMAFTAGETMDNISEEVSRVTRLMHEITNATDEQSLGIEQIALAVSQMDALAQQNASLVEESTAATRSLQAQSDDLIASMAVFQLEATQTSLLEVQEMKTQVAAA
ncbi:methyl-accepting chemotaxis protein [Acerihabitans sp. TG2]|uniref:methyl-accepting chemotaxis protein n=1 Tax=Acerihabitans sp. TG2 TaxID=3096008 RepID=UPI002B230936|nr:methyl-accepting chemotaxis protein [Acerihabitans sp. TG2]MEA9393074.1 methyl-accepting chemotaxis protein [Acerihabitans sp. TG2]